MEVLAERLELDEVPAEPDAEPEVPASEDVDLGRLLRDERGLPLRQHEHAGDELEAGDDRGQVAEQDEQLVELVLGRVRPGPVGAVGDVGAEHVVEGEQVVVAELLHGLRELANAARVDADLGLREDDADLHGAAPSASRLPTPPR